MLFKNHYFEDIMRDYDWGQLQPIFDADGDNTAQTFLATDGCLCRIEVANPNAAVAFLQLFDETGTITVGTTTPKMSILIPKGDGSGNYGSKFINFGRPGLPFGASIKYACTTTPTGSGDPTVGLTVNAIIYNPAA